MAWTCERVQDLAEIIVPLFDQYPPFRTKKRRRVPNLAERIVLQQILGTTLPGYSNASWHSR